MLIQIIFRVLIVKLLHVLVVNFKVSKDRGIKKCIARASYNVQTRNPTVFSLLAPKWAVLNKIFVSKYSLVIITLFY